MKKALGIIAVLIILGVSGFRIFMLSQEKQRPMMTPKVNIMSIKKTEIKDSFNTVGRIEAKYSVDLQARVQGYLQKRNFNEGEFVNKGDVLFLIEPYQYEASLNQAIALIDQQKATLDESEKNLVRVKNLVEKDFISKSEYDNALATRDRAIANLNMAKAQFDEAKLNLSYTKIKAPVSGRIGKIKITEGNYVSTDKGALASIVSLDPVYVTFNLPSSEFLKIQKDKSNSIKRKVELTLPDGSKYPFLGSEDFYNNQIDETTGTIQYRATFKNPDNLLLPGGFAKISIYSSKVRNEILVPQNAVLDGENGKFVYVIDKENKVKPRPVEAKELNKNNWIISKGLNQDETIAINGFQSLRPDIMVEVIKEEVAKNVQ